MEGLHRADRPVGTYGSRVTSPLRAARVAFDISAKCRYSGRPPISILTVSSNPPRQLRILWRRTSASNAESALYVGPSSPSGSRTGPPEAAFHPHTPIAAPESGRHRSSGGRRNSAAERVQRSLEPCGVAASDWRGYGNRLYGCRWCHEDRVRAALQRMLRSSSSRTSTWTPATRIPAGGSGTPATQMSSSGMSSSSPLLWCRK